MGSAGGRLVVTGMGKSGHIAGKIAATLTSTGSPAFFLHPAEAVHGDLGLVQPSDVDLVLSKSGETQEIAALLPCFRRLEVPVVAMTSRPDSTLGRAAAVVLRIPDMAEACPHNLAPTASTTAMLVLGDALAMALIRERNFTESDFADVHTGGIIGRRLLTRVSDLMVGPPLPLVGEDSPLRSALAPMTSNRGVCLSVDASGRLSGIFVYGDLGRLLETRSDALEMPVGAVLNRSPCTISASELATTALARMEKRGITSLVVTDPDGRPEGLVYLHDIMRAGIY
ncbi:KpsF/GutQ family sugar-phosphate isomerase [Candidatus Fermentibacteria bacterium]|nr:KpsF/GutQ family sugar-phosphate isomerase [Candidatus Fermentibacteria bacterium]